MLHVDEEHCGSPSRDWFNNFESSIAETITFTTAQKDYLLGTYAQLDSEIQPKDGCLVGFGYTNCQDISFMAVDLFEAIKDEVESLQA